jgi:hypothetical protein
MVLQIFMVNISKTNDLVAVACDVKKYTSKNRL